MRHSIPATMCNLATLCMLVMTPDVFAADRPQKNAVDAQFNAMDVNGDGKLCPKNMPRVRRGCSTRWMRTRIGL